MAEQAQKEPTMEEILSSIRKIIADDSSAVVEPDTASSFDVGVAEEETFEELDLNDSPLEMELPETEEDVLAAITQSVDTAEDVFEEEVEESEMLAEETYAEPEESFELPEPLEAEAEVEEFVEDMPVLHDIPTVSEPELSAPAPIGSAAPLTDSATVSAAAGSLSKLLSKVEFGEEAGGATTIDALVGELLRPMLKEWLDENLQDIVDKHVEAEVARIARMAR
ncbi:MAG: DUF2497 domain-containing protein [Henriciella sp.]|nr:DUF2497 domain-containing protein [Henriciella sp.]